MQAESLHPWSLVMTKVLQFSNNGSITGNLTQCPERVALEDGEELLDDRLSFWLASIFSCCSIWVMFACLLEKFSGYLLGGGSFKSVYAHNFFFVVQHNSERFISSLQYFERTIIRGGPFDSIAAKKNMGAILESWIYVRYARLGGEEGVEEEEANEITYKEDVIICDSWGHIDNQIAGSESPDMNV